MPSANAARNARIAISPRLATRTLPNIKLLRWSESRITSWPIIHGREIPPRGGGTLTPAGAGAALSCTHERHGHTPSRGRPVSRAAGHAHRTGPVALRGGSPQDCIL